MSKPKRKKKDNHEESVDPRTTRPAPAEPQKRENPDERRPEEWDPSGATP